jgi:hypothetical protein
MTPLGFLKLYAATVPILFAVDLVWLGLVAKARRCSSWLTWLLSAPCQRHIP